MEGIKTKYDIYDLYQALKNLESVVKCFIHLQNKMGSDKLLTYLSNALANHYNQRLHGHFKYKTWDNDELTSGEIKLRYICKPISDAEIVISYNVDDYGNVIYKWGGFEDALFAFLNYFCITNNEFDFSLPKIEIEVENYQRYRELALYLEDGWRLKDKIDKLWYDKSLITLTAKEFIKYLQDETNPPPNAVIWEKGLDWNQLIFDTEKLRIRFAPSTRNDGHEHEHVRWWIYDVNLAECETNVLTCQHMTVFEDRVLGIANTAKINMYTSLKRMEDLFLKNVKK